MICPNCGTECAEKAAFCDWCGAKLHTGGVIREYSVKEYKFKEAYLDYLNKAFDFEGRARRKEFWFACLWNFIFVLLIFAAGKLISEDLQFALEVVFYAGVFIPNISLAVRRVHDLGKSACWLFVGFVPVIGHIALVVVFLLDGEKKDNKYGKSTKYCI